MNRSDFGKRIDTKNGKLRIFDLGLLETKGVADIDRLPFSIRILVENLIRKLDGRIVTESDLMALSRWEKRYDVPVEIPYHPARVLMQDFTGVPAVVDLAAMRDAVREMGGDPNRINPLVPVELIIDHSVQVDYHGTRDALKKNVEKEYERNTERYALLKWAQNSFDNFNVVPPNSGICHQVNLEYLGRVVIAENRGGSGTAYPDTLVGTDSHTTMINGIGVMGWGVGGIEAEAVMLGQPYYMSIPEVIGVRFTGELSPGVTGTDLVLAVTERLRSQNVVEKFVEFFGPGAKGLTVADRATIANMSPEYGATMGFFPVDEKTIAYLRETGRDDQADIVEAYTRENHLYYLGNEEPDYTDIVEFDLSSVLPAVAGPARPQDRIVLSELKADFVASLRGREKNGESDAFRQVEVDGQQLEIGNGSLVIAAITSCTNTSNPFAMMGAGLLAKHAVDRGLSVPPLVKTSLAPGSRTVTAYLDDAGLTPYLDALGFHVAGYGCTTCIGNSGPLPPEIEEAIAEHDLTVAAVLSGNRNFEARIHQSIRANFLASPMLVVAFALAGRIDIDLTEDPVGTGPNGEPVHLSDIWPESEEIEKLVEAHVKTEFYAAAYRGIYQGDEFWRALPVTESTTYSWSEDSTYIRNPPYFEDFALQADTPGDIENARTLLMLYDSVTTDHISPAGEIPADYPAGRYLIENGVVPTAFNSYGSRRGNHEVMMRGTFGNVRIRNHLVSPKEGGYTLKFPESGEMSVFQASTAYRTEEVPLIVLGGKEYGTGSSRDWAAKGTALLGVKAVIAESFERIHRSNLVGMGVLPLVFSEGCGWESLQLKGDENYSIYGGESLTPRQTLAVKAVQSDGRTVEFEVIARLDTDVDVAYYGNGGILPYVLRRILAGRERRKWHE